MVFDTMKRELREPVDLFRRTTEWETLVACGKVNLADVSADARSAHYARLERVVELRGIRPVTGSVEEVAPGGCNEPSEAVCGI